MQSKPLIMVGLAFVFGGLGVLAAQRWVTRQANLHAPAPVEKAAPAPTKTIVVAAAPLRFGTEISQQHLREIPWPDAALPKGAFGSIKEILDHNGRRTALMAMEENEPVLKGKITGPGQRASLSALIDPAMKAVTVRVNDVNGVAGFVLPGERVDILLTRNLDKDDSWADVLLQNVKVLAVDQSADDRAEKPSVVKAVTLEVSTAQAQKLTLASTVGALSMVLRAAGTTDVEATQRVNMANLLREDAKASAPVGVAEAPAVETRRTATVGVARAMKRQEYSVPAQAPSSAEAPAKVSQKF